VDIAEFIEARQAEKRRIAEGLLYACRIPGKTPDFSSCGGPAAVAYWQRFTPMQVLVQMDAHRMVLREHVPIESIYGLVCKRCVSWQEGPWTEGGAGPEFGIAIPDPWPCLPVRAIAAADDEHDDYDAAWAPEKASA
jgi:hypothetical protein